jgi:ATP-dependent helicase HrpA
MREWRDIHFQIGSILKEHGFPIKQDAPLNPVEKYTAIHKSILSGFLSNIAVKKEKNIFQAARGKEVMIFPGSGLFNRAKDWVVAAEMVETTRLYARTVANVDSRWLEELGKDLCKYTCLAPHWDRDRQEVVASEQVSLFGLIILAGRPVSYSRINPEEASEIFIHNALVEGDLRDPPPFLKHNLKLVAVVKEMEDRLRRRDLLVSATEMFRFYRQKIGQLPDIHSLQKLLKRRGGDRFLRMSREDLLNYMPSEELLAQFPDHVDLGANAFECSYRFDPGSEVDGLTVKIPSTVAPLVPATALDWLVPGLLREKLTALIKGLPKVYRKKLVPIAETVEVIVNKMTKGEGNLITALSSFIHRHFGLNIPAYAWSLDTLPDHLRMRISITGPQGEELRCSRDKAVLSQAVPGDVGSSELETARKTYERSDIRRWDFGDLPNHLILEAKEGAKWVVFPALHVRPDHDNCLDLHLFENREKAIETHKKGVAKLFAVSFARDIKFLKKNLSLPPALKKVAPYFGGGRKLENSLFNRVMNNLFDKDIRTQKEFHAHAEWVSSVLLKQGRQTMELATPVLAAFQETRSVIDNLATGNKANRMIIEFLSDLKAWLARLVPQNFAELYDAERMIQLPRYLKALAIRAERACVNLEKDRAKAEGIKEFSDSLEELLKSLCPADSNAKRNAIEDFFWALEEFKVSVFAQELKTAIPMSKKRLEKKLEEIRRMV